LACLNPSTGNIVWQKPIGNEALQQIYAQDNKIIAVPMGIGEIKSFDALTGASAWQFSLTDLGNNSFVFWQGNSIAYKQYLFSVFKDQLLVINLNTGKPVYFKSIGFSDSSFRGQVAINQFQKLFYVQDRFSLVCFKLPKEVVF
jgi:outer membrane protein assembly factor BamB